MSYVFTLTFLLFNKNHGSYHARRQQNISKGPRRKRRKELKNCVYTQPFLTAGEKSTFSSCCSCFVCKVRALKKLFFEMRKMTSSWTVHAIQGVFGEVKKKIDLFGCEFVRPVRRKPIYIGVMQICLHRKINQPLWNSTVKWISRWKRRANKQTITVFVLLGYYLRLALAFPILTNIKRKICDVRMTVCTFHVYFQFHCAIKQSYSDS